MRRCIRNEKGQFAKHDWLELVEYEKGGGHRECNRCGHKSIFSGFDLMLRKVYLPTLEKASYKEGSFSELIAGR